MKYVWGSIAALVLLVLGGSWWVINTVQHNTGQTDDVVSITINKGAGIRDISGSLYDSHLVRSAQAWTLYVVLTGSRSDIHEGTYTLNHGMTGKDILHALTNQPTDERQVKVTIIEGSTNKEIAEQLDKAGVVSASEFLTAAGQTDSRNILPNTTYDFLASKPTSVDLEGFLFPDTYYFFKHSTAAAVIKKFLDNFDLKYTDAMRQATGARGRTIFEEVTMASIIEAELRSDTDRSMAADIFWRRLDAGIALNADTTVLYALGRSTGSLTNADLKVDSPYNTYLHRGLPAGPIGNPGISALRAAINPTPNEYWYYLTAKDGHTVYAKTLEEHSQNKVKYLY